VDAALETIGGHWFVTTVAGDEVEHGKPHPEPYLTAARRLGIEPASCVVFEDSPTGLAAGEAAGCYCVVVPDVVPVAAAQGRTVLRSLTEVDVDRLVAGGLHHPPPTPNSCESHCSDGGQLSSPASVAGTMEVGRSAIGGSQS
jgi:Haloacid dehalogenase-like hydrolase